MTCQLCDDAEATCVVLADLGDIDGAAAAAYRPACDGCKGNNYLTDPEPLTAEWERWFEVPYMTPPNERRAK